MTTPPKSISGLTDAAAARVVLFQSREFVTVPGNAMGLQATIPATGLLPGTIGGTGMVLQVVGGVPAWVEPASKFVASGSLTGANVDVDLSVWVAQGFKRFKLMWNDWQPDTNAAALVIRFSNNAGSSFQTTSYAGQIVYSTAAAATTPLATSQGSTAATLCGASSNASTNSSFGSCEFHLGTAWASFTTLAQYVTIAPAHANWSGSGLCVIADANAIRLLCLASGNHDQGHYAIHALKDF